MQGKGHNDEIRMTKRDTRGVFNLRERTFNFGVRVILFVRSLPFDRTTQPLISQLIRSATSIGANYAEADSSQTKKDFVYKICLCRKEAAETSYWLSLIEAVAPGHPATPVPLRKESSELALIFSSIYRRTKVD